MKRNIALISTGGTIEKTYDVALGALHNRVSNLDVMLSGLDLRGVSLHRIALMNKDSTEMTEADHDWIARTALEAAQRHDGVVVVHGTDRLTITGERVLSFGSPEVPIVFTGAMLPYELRRSDATQNLTEALCAVQLLDAGVFLAMHNRVLSFPGIVKDVEAGTFRRVREYNRRRSDRQDGTADER